MKFYDRKEELKLLQTIAKRSEKQAEFTLLTGRRRVGKTALLVEAVRDAPHVYLFVSRKSEPLLCAEFQQAISEALEVPVFGAATRFRELFEQLMVYSQKQRLTLIIDEFQDFERVNPAIFSDIQDVWDRYKDKARINFIASGSIYSLLVRIFENKKEPLFGRLTSKIALQPFSVVTLKSILHDYNPSYQPDDLLCLYLLSGGVPKYVSLLMDSQAVAKDTMLSSVCSMGSPFLTEGKELLVSEFGKDYSTYFSVLQLIASGKTTQPEVDSIIGKNTGAYLHNLDQEYSLLSKNQPLFAKPGSRSIRWRVKDSYLRFWFRFIYANQSLVETGRYDLLGELVEARYEDFSGLALEDYFRAKFQEEGRFTQVASFWDRKGENEIDLIALNGLDKTATIAEVKRNPKKISLAGLKEKSHALSSELADYTLNFEALSLDTM